MCDGYAWYSERTQDIMFILHQYVLCQLRSQRVTSIHLRFTTLCFITTSTCSVEYFPAGVDLCSCL